MILNGSQRGGGRDLAAHLSNLVDNDHVELHDVRGFTAETMRGAFQEAEAVAKGTECTQFLFSLSLNPPETERVGTGTFEAAVAAAEERLGLKGQPRLIVFHEKNGRRHAHAVWSRIDAREMKAIGLPFYKTRLTELSKDLFLEHGWRLPDGLRDHGKRDPRNFDLAEWQQAKRTGTHPREIKRTFQEAWQVSDTGVAFAHALEEKGYFLARGDRRGFVALDVKGEVYAIPKWTGLKTKEVRTKLGDPKALRSVAETKAHIAATMQPALSRWEEELAARRKKEEERRDAERRAMALRQREERAKMRARQEIRAQAEAKARQARYRTGLRGLWDRMRGEHRRIRDENDSAAWEALQRDRRQRDDLIFGHLEERRALKHQHREERAVEVRDSNEIAADRARFDDMRTPTEQHPRDGPTHER
ncbi:MAG: relaxase [Pseudomonadota bacterium]